MACSDMASSHDTTWTIGINKAKFMKLKGDLAVDVAIVGGGITGVTLAYMLSSEGKRVALIEQGELFSGATSMTTAFITESIDTDYEKMIKMYGARDARLIAESHREAIDEIERIVKKEDIDCEFTRCSNYTYAIKEKERDVLKKEKIAARKIGVSLDLGKEDLGFNHYGFLELKRQAKFHPLKYLNELAREASRNGAKIFENTEVHEIERDVHYTLRTNSGDIEADYVVVATYAPFDKKLYFKKAFYTTYVYELEVEKGFLKEGIYEDLSEPYKYFRVDHFEDYDRVIFGGEDHRGDLPVSEEKNLEALKDYIDDLFAGLDYKVIRKWKGPIVEPVDGLAYIGSYKDSRVFYATGFSGNGMTYGTLAGMIITNKICRKKDERIKEFERIYTADRLPTLRQLAGKGADYSNRLFHGALKNSLKYSESK